MPEVIDFYMVSPNEVAVHYANGDMKTHSVFEMISILQNGNPDLQKTRAIRTTQNDLTMRSRSARHRPATVVRIRMTRKRVIRDLNLQRKVA